VLKQREQSLGDVQRQRVQSGYQTASDLLSQTIKDVVARERYENNQALAEHAKAI
jgi:replicative DNA helicase